MGDFTRVKSPMNFFMGDFTNQIQYWQEIYFKNFKGLLYPKLSIAQPSTKLEGTLHSAMSLEFNAI